MTSASELFYTRRSRVGRPNPDPGIDSSIDRNYNRRYHNNRHDLDGCQHLRLSPHVRHSTSRSYSLSERASMQFDQGSSRFASINGVNAESVSSSNRQSLHSNERLPGAVLLARARLLERLRGVSVSANRRDGRGPPNPYDVREYLLCEDFREVDAGDWGSEISTGLSGGSSSFTDQTSQTEENNKKPPGLTQEAVDSLPLEVFRGEEVDGERESRDCSICLERFRGEDVLTRLVCGHRFHSTCLHPWVRSCGDCHDSSDSVSIDMESISLGGKEYLVKTHHGTVSVAVFGDQDKPALITYPDLALNHISCFQGLFFCPEASSLLLHNFCIYHISPPGHEFGAPPICPDGFMPSVDDLADQIVEVLNFFGLGAVMCMGVTAGAYILTLFAMKYRQRVLGLILISPLCRAPSWTEWLLNKVMSNLLYFYGMCGVVKELLLKRYFSKEVRGNVQVPESDIVQACRRLLDERQSINIWQFLEAMNGRPDLSEGLRKLHCRSLIFVGENSPFHSEALHMTSKLDRRYSALVEVQACGSMVTEEQPHAMLIPIEYFLTGYGLYRATLSVSPRSPLSPSCISPELLSPESMGLKLKPIKTRISLEV